MLIHSAEPAPGLMEKSDNILIVDDDKNIRTVLSLFFKKNGWIVQTAEDGVQALQKLKGYTPDIMMDIRCIGKPKFQWTC